MAEAWAETCTKSPGLKSRRTKARRNLTRWRYRMRGADGKQVDCGPHLHGFASRIRNLGAGPSLSNE